MRALSEDIPKDSIMISDMGLHKMWVSLPGAIASKLAKSNCPVIVVSGDGGFLMNFQEFETARRMGTVFTVIIFNDQSYGRIKKHQRDTDMAVTQVDFTNPDFNLFAQGFGGHT